MSFAKNECQQLTLENSMFSLFLEKKYNRNTGKKRTTGKQPFVNLTVDK